MNRFIGFMLLLAFAAWGSAEIAERFKDSDTAALVRTSTRRIDAQTGMDPGEE